MEKIITICEIKFKSEEISMEVIKEVEWKKSLLTLPLGYSIETALISSFGANKKLVASQYFDYLITLEDIFS
ncbi:MAG: hypothetical protein HQK49_07585 [Oligoflexia bacterium]|nr:hypothetical protein [Oligoflexia bacterium]